MYFLLSGDATARDAPWWERATTPTMIQYGVGFDGEFVLAPGEICAQTKAPCILGSGAGIAANLGVLYGRTSYLGLAYALTKQDPSRLYRLATLQQARLEFRKFLETERDLRFFGSLGIGAAGYGEEWSIDTYGPLASVAIGAEFELSEKVVAVGSIGYRAIRFSSFQDTAGTQRAGGLTHIFALEIALAARTAP